MKDIKSVKVYLWGNLVGYISLLKNGQPAFEYDESFKTLNLNISPIEMPVNTTTIFKQQNPATTFRGLPGVIADCLPDRFGMRVIRDFYREKFGMEDHEITILQRLIYVGKRSVGALEFTPSRPTSLGNQKDTYLNIQELRSEARKVLDNKSDIKTVEIMRVSGSAGGARAKALIDYNPVDKKIRSGFSKPKKDFIPCMIKFDGAKDGEETGCYGRLEYVYNQLAKLCDLNVPHAHLLEDNECAHFIIERFDRNYLGEKEFHYASLCGLFTKDFFQKHSCSYEEFFQITQFLTQDMTQVIEAFKISVFNIVFRNQDDHTKNFGFLMDRSGSWKLAPAFDLNYARDAGNANSHQMKLNHKDDNFTREDLICAGTAAGLKKRQINEIIEKTLSAAKQFLQLSHEIDLEEDFSEGVARNFRLEL